MHILHVSPYYAPAYAFGGVVSALEGLTQALVANGQTVTVLTTDALSLQAQIPIQDEMRAGVRVIRARNWLYPLRSVNLSSPLGLARLAHDILPTVDIVHLHEFRTVENQLIVPLALKANKPLILSPHGTLNPRTGRSQLKTLWDRLLSPRLVPHIEQVIALAQAEADDIQALWQSFGATAPISIIPNGVNPDDFANLPDTSAFRAQYGLGDAQVLLFMGRLQARKGVGLLVEAFKSANLSNTKLLIVGPDEGMLASLQAQANEAVIFTGYLSGEARLAALASADLFVLPAIGEGFSMAVLEAMVTGLPVLLSEGCNFPEAEQAQAGRIITAELAPLRTALQELCSQPDLLREMGQNARKLVLERYTWTSIAQATIQVYEKQHVSISARQPFS